jgi:hypothetical protein
MYRHRRRPLEHRPNHQTNNHHATLCVWPCRQVLIWDLFVGRAIWLDSLERGTPFTWSSLLLTNGIGPPGMLLYVLLCLVSGRGLPTLGYREESP